MPDEQRGVEVAQFGKTGPAARPYRADGRAPGLAGEGSAPQRPSVLVGGGPVRYLLRVLPARLPDVCADQGRGLVAAWADHADAGSGDREARRRRRPAAEGVVVLPGLPGLRAGVSGGGAVRAPAGDVA